MCILHENNANFDRLGKLPLPIYIYFKCGGYTYFLAAIPLRSLLYGGYTYFLAAMPLRSLLYGGYTYFLAAIPLRSLFKCGGYTYFLAAIPLRSLYYGGYTYFLAAIPLRSLLYGIYLLFGSYTTEKLISEEESWYTKNRQVSECCEHTKCQPITIV